MNVDLPEPDGPNATTTSPFFTVVVMPRRAWNSPYHLWTSRQTIMSSAASRFSLAAMFDLSLYMLAPLRLRAYRSPTPRLRSTLLLMYDMP